MNPYSMTLLFTALVAGASISKPNGNNVADYGDKYVPQQPYEPIPEPYEPEVVEPYVPDVVEPYQPEIIEPYQPEIVQPYQPEPSYGGDSNGHDSYAPENKGDCGRGHLHKHRSGKTHCHRHRHHHGRK